MRPHQLELEGFTAFRQHVDINFADLELFALIGDTGSGKSSILDAITFALYDATARLGSTKLDSLISQGKDNMKVSLSFEIGSQIYRITRTKGRKSSENEVRLEKKDHSEEKKWINLTANSKRETNAQICQLIGLDYERFTKSILLPQGKFSELLLATGSQRQELLGELCGLGKISEMAKIASQHEILLNQNLKTKTTLLSSEYVDVSTEAISEIKEQLKTTKQSIEDLAQQHQQLEQQSKQLQELQKADEELRSVRQSLKNIQSRSQQIQQDQQRIVAARRVAVVIPQLDEAHSRRIQLEQEQTEIDALAKENAKLLAQEHAAATRQQAAVTAASQLPLLEQQAEQLLAQEQLVKLFKRYKVSPQHSHPQPLAWDEDTYEQVRQQAQAHERWQSVNQQIERLNKEIAQQNKQLPQLEQQLAAVEKKGKQLKDQQTQLVEQEKELRQKQTLQLGLDSYRHLLQEGQPCPLCSQPVTELPEAPTDEFTSQIADKQQHIEQIEQQLKQLRDDFGEQRSEVNALKKSLDKDQKELVYLQQQQQKLPNYPEAAEQVQRLLADLAQQVRAATDDPASQRQKLLVKIKSISQERDNSEKILHKATLAASNSSATLKAKQHSSQRNEETYLIVKERLEQSLQQLQLNSQQVKEAFLPEPEIAALETNVKKHASQLAQKQQQLDDLEAKWGEIQFDSEQTLAVARQLKANALAQQEQQQSYGALQEAEKQMTERLERKEDLVKIVDQLASQQHTWSTLKESLKSNNFPKFMMAEIESRLLATAANILYQISGERYQLVLENANYHVRDLWNAGETRAVKTLSGGETFLASLALAVALSDYLAGQKKLGALFLDEGFGTLDQQALDAVVTALESLKNSERMVGIVTHIDSLSERMPSKIILNKSNLGTTVQQD